MNRKATPPDDGLWEQAETDPDKLRGGRGNPLRGRSTTPLYIYLIFENKKGPRRLGESKVRRTNDLIRCIIPEISHLIQTDLYLLSTSTIGNRYVFTILFHMDQTMHIMYYLLTKEEMQMAFGGVDDCCHHKKFNFVGIAIVVVIILLLIAMGIVF